MLAYRAAQTLLNAAMNVFFQDVHLVGLEHVPLEGERAVLFAGNHPNSLIDPVLLCTGSGRIVHFAAKDKLFTFPLSLLLRALGAVPIARRMDHGDTARDNTAALDALYQVLAEGRAVGIFPEGLSHNEAQLQRIRTGAARIALDAASRHAEAGVQVVCCGLTYVRREHFRSRVLVQFGPPIDIDAGWVARWTEDERAATAALTTDIEAGLRALTVNAPDWETLRVLDGVRRLYQPRHISLADRVELSRRFSEGYQSVADKPDIAALYSRIAAYQQDLDDVGLTDRDLVRGLDGRPLSRRALRSVLRLVLWLPLALPGAPIHLPLLIGVGLMGRTLAPRDDVVGTSRLVLGATAVATAWVLVPAAVALTLDPWWGAMVAVALPISGIAALRVLERGVSVRRLVRSALAGLRLGQTLRALQQRRTTLQDEVQAAVERHIPDDLVRLFPPPP